MIPQTENQKKEFWSNPIITPILITCFVLGVWAGGWWYINWHIPVSERGTFGDKFGFANSLFSGLAFAGIIYSLILQRRELELQRAELRETRQEFKQQNFETTFFNLLKNQQEITNRISASFMRIELLTQKKYTLELTGVGCFIEFYHDLKYIFHGIPNHSNLETYQLQYLTKTQGGLKELNIEETNYFIVGFNSIIVKEVYIEPYLKIKHMASTLPQTMYDIFFQKQGYFIGHYFRNLYHILKFVQTSEDEEIQTLKEDFLLENKKEEQIKKIREKYFRYAQFVQAQMSTHELLMLYYNCFSFPKMHKLCKYYQIFDNVDKGLILEIKP